MKRLFHVLILLCLPGMLAACGSAASDHEPDPGPPDPDPPLPFGTFTKKVEPDISTDGAPIPFNISGYRRYMFLYLADDINGSGSLESISLPYHSALSQPVTCPNTTINIGQTSVDGFLSPIDIFADQVNQGKGSAKNVLDDATVTIPPGVDGEYFTIHFEKPFSYNGIDNLVIDIERTASCDPLDVRNTVELLSYYALLFSSSPGMSSGTSSDFVPHMNFGFTGGDNAIIPQEGTVTATDRPFKTGPVSWKVQLLYLPDDINGSGPITGIGFPAGNPTTAQEYTLNIRLGHSTRTPLSSNFATNFNEGDEKIVADSVTFRVPDGVPVGDYVWLPLPDAVFSYDGDRNLIVEIDVTDNSKASVSTEWRVSANTGTNVRVAGESGSDNGLLSDTAHHIKFRFNGGTMDMIGGGSGDDIPFNGSINPKQQYLYHAAELGTGGNITKLACRYADATDSNDAANYPDFNVVLGHTAKTTLSETFADNMDDKAIVYTGNFPMPGALKQGDWIEIPLHKSFTYDPTKNLVVEMASDSDDSGSMLTHRCFTNTSQPTHYAQRRAWTNIRTDDNVTGAGGIDNSLGDLKLWISR